METFLHCLAPRYLAPKYLSPAGLHFETQEGRFPPQPDNLSIMLCICCPRTLVRKALLYGISMPRSKTADSAVDDLLQAQARVILTSSVLSSHENTASAGSCSSRPVTLPTHTPLLGSSVTRALIIR